MTRQECERELTDLMEQAWNLFKAYAPDGSHLTMFATKDGSCAMGYTGDVVERVNIIDGYKSPRGCYRYGKEETR